VPVFVILSETVRLNPFADTIGSESLRSEKSKVVYDRPWLFPEVERIRHHLSLGLDSPECKERFDFPMLEVLVSLRSAINTNGTELNRDFSYNI
jgi:hypothetical protein